MPAVLSLPVELLLEIFSLASPKSPSQDFSVYSSRQRDLRSFSLVRRTWTSMAQAVLEEEIWIDRRTRFETSSRSRRTIEEIQRTKYLTVGDSYRSILASRAVSDGWAGLKYLRYVPDKMFLVVGLAEFTRLPNLETLQLDDALVENDLSDQDLTFHRLRRLNLGPDTWFRVGSASNQQIFSPARMPNLVYLSFDVNSVFRGSSRVLDLILPQLETLAFSDQQQHTTRFQLKEVLARARNLKHLALPRAFDATSFVENYDFRLELESLHLPIQSLTGLNTLDWRQATRDWLAAVAKGERRNVAIDKIAVYGSKREALEIWPTPEFDLFEWREDLRRLAVEEFDGR